MFTLGDLSRVPSLAARITTQSALNPLLWLCALTTLPAWAAAPFQTGWIEIGLFASGGVPVLAALTAYFYLLFIDPDRLQSERFQLTRHQYQLLGDDRISTDRLGAIIEGSSKLVPNPTLSEDAAR
jgi:hypothetical protein